MKIKYPNGIVKEQTNTLNSSHAHKGMMFENNLNISNEYYRNHGKAVIYKKPVPIQIVKVDYPSRNKAKIVEAYYKLPSTTDYNGVYKGRYVDYEAKETIHESFAFKHIYEHQVEHLVNVDKCGGIAFVIIYFKKHNDVIIIDINQFNKLYLQGKNDEGLKSIPYTVAKEIGEVVSLGYTPPVDYLKAVDKMYFGDK